MDDAGTIRPADSHPTGALPPLSVEQVHPDVRVNEEALVQCLLCVIQKEDARLDALTVVLADHDVVLDLNRRYLGHDYHTDVLSFALGEGDEAPGTVDGEVYVDVDTAREQHERYGAALTTEIHRYAVHGLLHLIGYTDSTPNERAAMRALEDRYLRDCNV